MLNLTFCMSPGTLVNISSAAADSKGLVCSPRHLPSATENKHTSNTHSQTRVLMAQIVAWNSHSPRPRANNKKRNRQMFDKGEVPCVWERGVSCDFYGLHWLLVFFSFLSFIFPSDTYCYVPWHTICIQSANHRKHKHSRNNV